MSPVLSVNLMGGVGNQLFQIATGYAIAQKTGLRFCLVRNQFGGQGQGSHPSKYYDTLYRNIEFVDALHDVQTISQNGWGFYYLYDEVGAVHAAHPESDIILSGYFQCPSFFDHYFSEIKALLSPPEGICEWLSVNSGIFNEFPELRSTHSFGFIGVRRGDYMKAANVHLPCGMTYYNEGIRRLKAAGCSRFYIASDDMAWVKANFSGDEFRYIEIADDLEQLYVMALFSKYILANSSYHWWGSFLSIYSGVRCIVPDKWIKISGYESIYRVGMEIVERPVEF